MAEEKVTSEETIPASGDDASKTEETKQLEKVEISKEELETLKLSGKESKEELETLKQTIYSPEYVAFLESRGTAKAQEPEENLEFMSQKDLVQKLRNEYDQKLQNLMMGMTARQQEQGVLNQIKDAEKNLPEFTARRPVMKKIAERIGGQLSAEDAYRLEKSYRENPSLRKPAGVAPKPTEKPGTSSGTVKKTQFSEPEALEEAARTSGLDKLLESRK